MKMEMLLTQTLKQKLSLKQQYSLRVLSMGTEDLHHFLEEQLLENPLLEIRDSFYEMRSAMSNKYDQILNYVTTSKTLEDELEAQLHTMRVAIREDIAMFLIHSLDERGYLTMSEEDIKKHISIDHEDLEDIIAYLQTFEPHGVFARSLQECLLIQLSYEQDPYTKTAIHLLNDHMQDLQKSEKELSRILQVSTEEIAGSLQLLHHLNPSPGAAYQNASTYVIPEVFLEIDEDKTMHISLMNYGECVYVCDIYEGSEEEEIKKYTAVKKNEANMLLGCMQKRYDTIKRIVTYICDYQKDYFIYGKDLKPLTMEDIAQAISIHVSTVSRTIASKYMEFNNDIFPIKKFLCKKIDEDVSTDKIQKLIKQYIAEENKAKPYSDQVICGMLEKEGYQVSRRTIAKYRTLLHIPATSKRKSEGR